MANFWDILEIAANVGVAILTASHFHKLVTLDRAEAIEQLSASVQSMSAKQLDEFELAFLSYSNSIIDPAQRIRAMELYAWLKIAELTAYQKFRGFATSGVPL